MQSGDSFRDVLNLGNFFSKRPTKRRGLSQPSDQSPAAGGRYHLLSVARIYISRKYISACTFSPNKHRLPRSWKAPFQLRWPLLTFPLKRLPGWSACWLHHSSHQRRMAKACRRLPEIHSESSHGFLSADYNQTENQIQSSGRLDWDVGGDAEDCSHLDVVDGGRRGGTNTDTQSKYCNLKVLARLQRRILLHSYRIGLCQRKARGQVWF